MCAFNDTPNNGGEDKAWVTPVGDFVGDPNIVDNGYSAAYFHGFIPAASKTDNFKVKSRPGVCITIKKFVDFDGDGKPDAIEPYVQWPVYVTGPLGDVIQGVLYTGSPASKFPDLKVCNLAPGEEVCRERSALRRLDRDGEYCRQEVRHATIDRHRVDDSEDRSDRHVRKRGHEEITRSGAATKPPLIVPGSEPSLMKRSARAFVACAVAVWVAQFAGQRTGSTASLLAQTTQCAIPVGPALPDLIVDRQELAANLTVADEKFTQKSCGFQEGTRQQPWSASALAVHHGDAKCRDRRHGDRATRRRAPACSSSARVISTITLTDTPTIACGRRADMRPGLPAEI